MINIGGNTKNVTVNGVRLGKVQALVKCFLTGEPPPKDDSGEATLAELAIAQRVARKVGKMKTKGYSVASALRWAQQEVIDAAQGPSPPSTRQRKRVSVRERKRREKKAKAAVQLRTKGLNAV